MNVSPAPAKSLGPPVVAGAVLRAHPLNVALRADQLHLSVPDVEITLRDERHVGLELVAGVEHGLVGPDLQVGLGATKTRKHGCRPSLPADRR